jgi:hypothetical protein
MAEKINKLTVDEALSEFYKLKSKYEENYHDKYIKPIIRSKNKSKREKRLEYQKLPPPECINCKRNVGSIFTIKKNPELYFRQFIAKCGDLKDPCPFNIEIEYTQRSELSKELLDHDHDINTIKNKIIADKNNMMFGYINQKKAIETFNKDTTELKDITEAAGYILDINIQLNDNPVKTELIKTTENRFGVEFLLPFKSMIHQFDQTGNSQHVNTAVKLYLDEMVPLIKTIRDLKYEVCYIDYIKHDETDDLNLLVQKKNSLYNLEYTLHGNDELNMFIKGVKNVSSKSKIKTRKNGEPGQTHKTRKLRPDIEFVLKDDEEAEDEEAEDEDQPTTGDTEVVTDNPDIEFDINEAEVEGETAINPKYNDNGSVSWIDANEIVNTEYQQIWDRLMSEYKAALASDEAWMKKTMDNFVEFAKLQTERKLPYGASRQFVHPDGLLLPPKKIGDFEYDYGNIFYNSLLNKRKSNGIWLTFLPKSPQGSYQQYLDGLASIIGNHLKFTKY